MSQSLVSPRQLNYLAFALLIGTTLLGYQSLWGVLFLYWAAQGLKSSHAFLLSPVIRQDDPVLFWLIQAVWVFFGIWMIGADLDLLLR